MTTASGRPLIHTVNNKIHHNQDICRIVMRRNLISVGCTDVTPDALYALLEEYRRLFPSDKEVIVQTGFEKTV